MGAAALRCAELGWPVLPLRPGTKQPLTAHGVKDASADPERVRDWWARWPMANIGVTTGPVSGLYVVDVDGDDGDDLLFDLAKPHGGVPDTLISLSGKPGHRHIWFMHSGDPVVGRRLGVELELKGQGQYVVVPPSVHPEGTTYSFDGDVDVRSANIAELPAWVRNSEKRTAATEREPDRIRDGCRNNTLMSIAGRLRRRGLTEEAIAAELGTINEEQCDPPLDPAEVASIAKNAARYPPATQDVDAGPAGAGTQGSAAASRADEVLRLALARMRVGVSLEGEPFVVVHTAPALALMLRESQAIEGELAALYYDEHQRVVAKASVSAARVLLEGLALRSDPESVYLRVAPHGDGIVVDLGHNDGTVVIIDPGGWQISTDSPVLFRRTPLTAELPLPRKGRLLDEVWGVLNVAPPSRPLLQAFLVSALMPDVPHPIALFTGEQGTGKTTAGRLLIRLIDPSPAPFRNLPRSERDWAVTANASWVIGLDNVSEIRKEHSDLLCKLVTGDGFATRQMYTNSGVTVLSFRRVVFMTAIDPGALRGDLAERIVRFELEHISPDRRELERDIEASFEAVYPELVAALFDLTARVLAVQSGIKLVDAPRMADFAAVVKSVDQVLGTSGLSAYLAQGRDLADIVLADDAVGAWIIEHLNTHPVWCGTYKELIADTTPTHSARDKDIPDNPQRMAAHIKRLRPDFERAGIQVTYRKGHRGKRTVKFEDTRTTGPSSPSSPSSPQTQGGLPPSRLPTAPRDVVDNGDDRRPDPHDVECDGDDPDDAEGSPDRQHDDHAATSGTCTAISDQAP
jgi:hypothetical protein